MRYKKFFLLAFSMLPILPINNVYADTLCSAKGYTVLTINGILTDLEEAIYNKDALTFKLKELFKGEPIKVDFLHNPSHLAGANDFIDVLQQGLFGQKADYDLMEMLGDASDKIKTQKVLFVAHSQGNFYANNFYDKVASQEGGIPRESIGVYGVGSPASRVAGNGKYLTSDTDSVIAAVAARYFKILPPNVHIPLTKADGNGHSFSDVYLRHQGERIVSDIKASLGKLKSNDEQLPDAPCVSAPELGMFHKVQGVVLSVADPAAATIQATASAAYKLGVYLRDSAAKTGIALGNALERLAANVIQAVEDEGTLTTAFSGDATETSAEETSARNSEPEEEKEEKVPERDESNQEGENTVIAHQEADSEDKTIPPSSSKSSRRSSGGSGGSSRPEETEEDTGETGEPESGDETPESDENEEGDSGETGEPEDETQPEEENGEEETPDEGPEEEPEPDQGEEGGDEEPSEPEEEPGNNFSTSDLNGNGLSDATENEVTLRESTTLSAGTYSFKSLMIESGVTLTLEGDESTSESFKGVKIVADNITVESGASISADGEGYDDGPGFPEDADDFAGPSYAGMYGSAMEPLDLGTGGFGNNYGGGAIWLVVSGTLLNDGAISANGDENSTGGSILVEASTFSGEGTVSANGGGLYLGSSIYASGSGGRIAVYYEESSWAGNVFAKGGCGSYDGITQTCAENGSVGFIDDRDEVLYAESSWEFLEDDGPFAFDTIIIANGADAVSDEDVEIIADELLIEDSSVFAVSQGTLTLGELGLDGESTLVLGDDADVDAGAVWLSGDSVITTMPEETLMLNAEDLDIESGSSISADGKGYADGPGASDQGASHGGKGWGGAATYGSEAEPEDFGSGGWGSFRGGGAIRLTIADTLSNDGTISAGGEVTSSGGSIYVSTDKLLGSGAFHANGGTVHVGSEVYGPGGGGRIAIYYEESTFTGEVTAAGASAPGKSSEAGTVVLAGNGEEKPEEEPVPGSPGIENYTFNGIEGDITANPAEEPLILRLVASENVDWVSVIIESENDGDVDKQFRSGSNCEDWTLSCEKVWDGTLSGGGNAPEGTYKVKVHIKDADGNTFQDFLEHTIIVDFSVTSEEEPEQEAPDDTEEDTSGEETEEPNEEAGGEEVPEESDDENETGEEEVQEEGADDESEADAGEDGEIIEDETTDTQDEELPDEEEQGESTPIQEGENDSNDQENNIGEETSLEDETETEESETQQ